MRAKTLFRLTSCAALVALALPIAAKTGAGTKPRYGDFGVDLTSRDEGVKPGDDFWTYANGGWAKSTEIPADKSGIGYFNVLADDAELNVRKILDEMAANPAKFGATGKQVGDFYASWMDEAGIEAKGTAPLKPYLDRIDAAKSKQDVQVLFASTGFESPVGIGTSPSLADPTRYTAAVGQGGLGMARDNYLLDGGKYAEYRKAYRAYIEQMLTLGGVADAAAKADKIFALETALATVQWSPIEGRNIARQNDPQDIAGLTAKAPDWDWALMLKTAGLDSSPKVLMGTNTALVAEGRIFTATPVETWKAYLAFHFISDNAAYLPKAFDDARFQFYSHTLGGAQAQRDRWKRGVQLTNGALGEAVGKLYVDRYFPPVAQTKAAELIEDLRASYQQRIEASSWMDEATKKAALAKLAAFEPRIGHPVNYINYSSFKVVRGDMLGNAQRAAEFGHQLELERFPKPVDRSLWALTPQTVNAYYNPLSNQITFPAAILQPPFFDANADAAVNYGAIGAVIGHEMGHGFDDQGSQFGPSGKFENWWTPEAKEKFKARTAALVAQYDKYEAVPGTNVKGGLTLGENIGDLGGVEAAYGAYKRYQAKHGAAPVIDGLTGDQRFFLAYAQAWQAKLREDTARNRASVDPHSPPYFRVNGIVRNVDAWYAAFGVKPGDKLYLAPEQRVHIW